MLPRPRVLPALVLSLAGLGLGAASSAHADGTDFTKLPPVLKTLSISSAVARTDCAVDDLAGKPGVTTVPYVVGKAAALYMRMDGNETDDWDLAVFNHATGKRITGSAAWGSNEVVTMDAVAAGAVLDIQACRISGTATSMPLQIDAYELPTVAAPNSAADKEQLVTVDVPDQKTVTMLDNLGLDLGEDGQNGHISAVLHTANDAALLRAAGLSYKVDVPDLALADMQDREKDDAASTPQARSTAATSVPSGRTSYRILADVQSDLKAIVAAHPAIARPVTLPVKTFEQRDTTGIELSSDVGAKDDQKPVSFIMGLHHAREWPSEEMNVEFATYLAKGYGTDPAITKLLDTTRVVIVPVINSDGFVASREAPVDPADSTGDPAGAPSLGESVAPPFGGTLAYRRKNCDGASPEPATPCDAQYGIDPNRNYGYNWGGPGASTDTGSQSYRGTGQWSEPETQAVHQYSQNRPINSLMTVHNFASLVLRPPALHTGGLAPDEARLKAIGDSMAADTGYTSEYSYMLYDTSGTTEDWNYGAAGTYGYTVELGPPSEDGGNFHVAYQQAVIDQWNGTGARAGHGMRSAMMTIAEAASSQQDFSTVAGYAPPGRVIRLKKTFKTYSAPVCTIADPTVVAAPAPAPDQSCVMPTDPVSQDDYLNYTTTVPVNGRFAWLVPPSTHPFVAKAGGSEAYTLTCEDTSGHVFQTEQLTIARNQRVTETLPCGGALITTPPADSATTVPGAVTTLTTTTPTPGVTTKDTLAPQSRLTKGSIMATRAGVQLAGTSADFAPSGLDPRLAKVYVALGRQVGKKCTWATKSGKLGRKTSCTRTPYLPALGTQTWTFLYQHKLPKGHYIAWIRGVDAAGNKERKAKTRNLVKFNIK